MTDCSLLILLKARKHLRNFPLYIECCKLSNQNLFHSRYKITQCNASSSYRSTIKSFPSIEDKKDFSIKDFWADGETNVRPCRQTDVYRTEKVE